MGSSGHHPPELFEMGWDGFCSEIPLPPHKKVWDDCTLWRHITRLLETTQASWDLPQGIRTFPRGLQKAEGGKRICWKMHSRNKFQLWKGERYWMYPEKSPQNNVFLLCRWLIQSCNLSLSSHSLLLCSLRFPDEHHPSSYDTASGRKYGIWSFSGKLGKLANSLSKEEKLQFSGKLGAVAAGAEEDKQPNHSNHQSQLVYFLFQYSSPPLFPLFFFFFFW